MTGSQDFDQLITEALQFHFEGWDFSSISGRWQSQPPHWNYRQIVTALLPQVDSLLDMGTGGGEFLASLHPLPLHTRATENYAPNIPVAQIF